LKTSTLSSNPDTLSLVWSTLLKRLSVELFFPLELFLCRFSVSLLGFLYLCWIPLSYPVLFP
jgi:hypothetical protein